MAKKEGIRPRFTLIAITALLWIFMGAKPIRADAATTVASGTCGDDLTWVLDEDGLLTISGTGAMTDWDKGADVDWNDYCTSITSVTINNGVTTIGNHAFTYCQYMTTIIIPDSITSIGSSALFHCDSLVEITIPSNVSFPIIRV